MVSIPERLQVYISGSVVPRVAVALIKVLSTDQLTLVRSAFPLKIRASLLVSAVVEASPTVKEGPLTADAAMLLMPSIILVGGVESMADRACVTARGSVFLYPT